MKCIHGHYYSELDNHHICMHYNTYFGANYECPSCGSVGFEPSKIYHRGCTFCDGTEGGVMPESPNDSDSTKELRDMLRNTKELISLYKEDLNNDKLSAANDELEAHNMCARKLLRCWKKATEKDHTTEERHLLNRLTDRLLDGV